MPSIIAANAVSFEFPNGRSLLNSLNFTLERGLTALVGPNGVGKTTLARLIAGELEPTSGSLRRQGVVRYFRQREEPPSGTTVAAYLGPAGARSALGARLLSGVDRESICTHLSGGQWMRVRLARVLGDEFLILDEPTNDLDREGRTVVLDFLSAHEGGALLVSHDRECLGLCDDVFELSAQGLAKHGGGWSEYERAKARERAGLETALERAKLDRATARADRVALKDRQEKRNRRGVEAAARGGMPKILIGARKRRAQATTGRIDSETLARKDQAVRDAHEAFAALKVDPIMYADLAGAEPPAQKLIAEARGFNVRYDDWLYAHDLDFAWRGGARVALKGGNGSGKSTLIKALLGGPLVTRGELRCGRWSALYVDQRCADLDDSLSVIDNVRKTAVGDESALRNGLAKFLFTKDDVFRRVDTLSGGERLRAALAKGLLSPEKPELLILDEPTNNLDLANVEFLEGLVRQFRGAVLLVSHDEIFLRNCGITDVFKVEKSRASR